MSKFKPQIIEALSALEEITVYKCRMESIPTYPAVVIDYIASPRDDYGMYADITEQYDIYILVVRDATISEIEDAWLIAEESCESLTEQVITALKQGCDGRISIDREVSYGHDVVDGTWCAVGKIKVLGKHNKTYIGGD